MDAVARSIAPSSVGVALLAMALYAMPLAFNLPLTDPDEGLHAAIAQDMVDRGDFAVPRFLGTPFLDKPVLFFFAQAVAIAAFGATEFAVRLPGHVFGLLGAVTTGALAAAVAGRWAGVVAACIHATLFFPLALNQAAVHDVALVPWINLALLCFLRAMRDRALPGVVVGGWCAAAGIFLALAMLTKGLVGVALVGLPVAVLALIERRLSGPLFLGGVASLLVAAGVALPWYLAMERAAPGYLQYFFVQRHLLGFTTTTQLHGQRSWWYYVPVVIGGSLPWVLTAPAAWSAGSRGTAPLPALRRLAVVWLLVDGVFLGAAGSKLATYVLPLFPAVAILATAAWLGAASGTPRGTPRSFRWMMRAQALAVAVSLPAACFWVAWWLDIEVRAFEWGLGTVLALGWVAIARASPGWPLSRSFAMTLGGIAAVLVAGYLTVLPDLAARSSARDLARYFNARGALPPRLWIVDERVGSFLFYLQPALRSTVTTDTVDGMPLANALLKSSGVAGTVLAVRASTVEKLEGWADLTQVRFEPAGRYRIYSAEELRNARPHGGR
jgi:4-amino-4-deoxy-L-arabinose transferase-like glycosyltransferase